MIPSTTGTAIFKNRLKQTVKLGESMAAPSISVAAGGQQGNSTTLTSTTPPVVFVTGGGAQTVVLPAEENSAGRSIWIHNAAGGAVTVDDDAGGAVGADIADGDTGVYFCDGTAWHKVAVGPHA